MEPKDNKKNICIKCGSELEEGAIFCGRCGTKQEKAGGGGANLSAMKSAPQSQPSQAVHSQPPQGFQAGFTQYSQGFQQGYQQPPQGFPPQQGYPMQSGYPHQPYGYPQQPQMIITQQPKSMGLALILTFLFGPLGLLYANVRDGLILICIAIAVAFLTLGMGLIFVWIGSMVWAYMDVEKYNKALMSGQPLPPQGF